MPALWLESCQFPPSWATATPTIRTVAAALSAARPGSLTGGRNSGHVEYDARGGDARLAARSEPEPPPSSPTVAFRGRLTPLKDLKGNQSPEQLKRLVAQISLPTESVQHHPVNQEGLDSLLEQLAKKPGVHAVHLSKSGKAKVRAVRCAVGLGDNMIQSNKYLPQHESWTSF